MSSDGAFSLEWMEERSRPDQLRQARTELIFPSIEVMLRNVAPILVPKLTPCFLLLLSKVVVLARERLVGARVGAEDMENNVRERPMGLINCDCFLDAENVPVIL
jgi:hypothetical protein